MKSVRFRSVLLVMFALFMSGAAGLIYEVVWARYLALFLGHSSFAVAAVLTAFMGGLALGNAWLGPRADKTTHPLMYFALLEFGIGIFALAFPVYDPLLERLFDFLAGGLSPCRPGQLALKFSIAILAILPPSVLMGGTLPVLARFFTSSLSHLRERIATLYFLNCVGAAVGCVAADFLWIPAYGLPATILLAALLNWTAAIIALLLHRSLSSGKTTETVGPAQSGDERFSRFEVRLAAIAIGVSGFVAMSYEVLWTRLLALVLGSSVHAFSVMLATFIFGIATGSLVVSQAKNSRNSMAVFAWSELALASTLMASLLFYRDLPFWFAQLAGVLARRDSVYPLYVSLQGLICFGVLFPATVFLGMTLPLASRIAASELAHTGRSVGRIFSINTLGGMVGAMATGLWLMPSLGLSRAFGLGIAINLVLGIVLLNRNRCWFPTKALLIGLLFVGAGTWLAGQMFSGKWERALTLGVWREPDSIHSLSEFRKVESENNLAFYRDGAGATVSVNSWTAGDENYLTLRINGKPDASTTGDMSTQLLLGHLPLLLKPDSQRALVVGLGSAISCGAVACHPGIKTLDAVEISPDVVSAARLFANANNHVLDDPRLRLIVDDARSFLRMNNQTYDVIISEPSNPWMAGVASVFSREFFESCRAHLATNGLMAQWIHLYETSDEAFDLVVRTFASVFPSISVWQSRPADLILIGSREPPQIDLQAMDQAFEQSAVRRDLARIQLTRLPVLLAREVVSERFGRFLPESGSRIHTDFRPVLEYAAQRAFFVHGSAERWRAFDETVSPRASTLLGEYLRNHPLSEEDFRAFARFHFANNLPTTDIMRSLFHRWQRDLPASNELLEFSARLAGPGPAYELEALRWTPLRETLFARAANDPSLLRDYARLLMQTYRAQRSVFLLPPAQELKRALERLIETDGANKSVYELQLAELAWDAGDDESCVRLSLCLRSPTRLQPEALARDPELRGQSLVRLVAALVQLGRTAEARELKQQFEAGPGTEVSSVERRKMEAAIRSVSSR